MSTTLQDRQDRYFLKSFGDDLKRLLKITAGCGRDMHEPDEEDVRARVVGDHLDNAFGEGISTDAIMNGYQEFVVILERDGKLEKFNLASLIALARMADVRIGEASK
jgi:ethanolamine ammonia-lyase small subunit